MRNSWLKIGLALLLCISMTACHKQSNENEVSSNTSTSKTSSSSKVDYKDLKGTYADCVSGEAKLEIDIAEDKESVDIVVNWVIDETETTRWEMNATLKSSRLAYKESQEYLITYDDYGNEIPVSISKSSGYFTYNKENGTLVWNGSSQTKCQTCIFEKVSSTTTKEEEERRKKEEEAAAKKAEEDEQEESETVEESVTEEEEVIEEDTSYDEEYQETYDQEEYIEE